jgi:hypothetical protein
MCEAMKPMYEANEAMKPMYEAMKPMYESMKAMYNGKDLYSWSDGVCIDGSCSNRGCPVSHIIGNIIVALLDSGLTMECLGTCMVSVNDNTDPQLALYNVELSEFVYIQGPKSINQILADISEIWGPNLSDISIGCDIQSCDWHGGVWDPDALIWYQDGMESDDFYLEKRAAYVAKLVVAEEFTLPFSWCDWELDLTGMDVETRKLARLTGGIQGLFNRMREYRLSILDDRDIKTDPEGSLCIMCRTLKAEEDSISRQKKRKSTRA